VKRCTATFSRTPWNTIIADVTSARGISLDFSSHPLSLGSRVVRRLGLDEEVDKSAALPPPVPLRVPPGWRGAPMAIGEARDDISPGAIGTPQIDPGAVTGNSPYINDTPNIVGTTSETVVDQIDVAGVPANARVDLQVFYLTSVASGANTIRLRKGTTTGGTLLDSFTHGATEQGTLIASDATPGMGTQSYVLTMQATNVASSISRVRAMRLLAKR
jgi:hypothetical protein